MASRVKRRELKTTFTAEDARGNTHRVHVCVDILNAAAMGNSHAESEGLPSLKTERGVARAVARNPNAVRLLQK